MSITPQELETRLIQLDKAVDATTDALNDADASYDTLKAQYEIAMAKSRIKNAHPDMKMTVQMRDDQALIDNEELHLALAAAEIAAKAAKANVNRIGKHIDITRSMGTNLRNEMSL